MKKWIIGWSLLFCILISVGFASEPEMRACWISRFEWPSSNETTCKNRIRTMMQTLKNNNFNAVLFQIRGECNTLYPSPYEPWGPQFNWTNPGWDPAAYAIQEAHANGLEFHAYINTHTITQNIPPANTSPQHIYNLHARPGSSPNWQIHGTDGLPAEKVDGYIWLSPGIPDAEAWTRQAIMHVVTTYDVDGVHFDRIRTPASSYSHDPISEARFAGEGNPDHLDWGDWMRSQITRQLRKIYGAVHQVKPHVKITSAPFGICKKEPGGYQGSGTQSYYSWYQDSFGWMESHVQDAIFPQIYWEIGSAHPFEVLLGDFLNHTGGRHIYAGMITSNDVIAQVYETRSQGAPGTTVFSYYSTDFSAYKNGPYSEPAEIPAMSWLTNPSVGIIVGYVKYEAGNPVVDAKINRTADSYNYLSSGDGFYSILDVAPGTYTLTASKSSHGTISATASLSAGDVIQVDLIFDTSRGTLSLDKDVYWIGESIQVTLVDPDLAGEPSATVEAKSDRESSPETLTLLPEGDSGRFEGAISLADSIPQADGVLQAHPGDLLTFTYHDAFDGIGPADIVETAEVEDTTEFIIDNDEPGFTYSGDWGISTQGNIYGCSKRFNNPGDGSDTTTWNFDPIPPGTYEVAFWINDNNYASSAGYYIKHDEAPAAGELVSADQNFVGDGWHELGTFSFTGGNAEIILTNASWQGEGIYVVADAMRLDLIQSQTTKGSWSMY